MAVIGPMRKLTIGNKTYQIVTGADSLPIASTSTLGAIKVGTGLTIDSSTGVLNATGTSLVIDNELSGTSTNPVQNKVIKTALDNKADSNDIPTKVSDLTNDSGFTSNTGTVTSVRVQATSPVQSSTSTAQNSSLNTTISLADGYGDTKNPYGTKTANYILAGPSSGNAAAPSFRELVASDIPDLSETYLTSFTETDPVFSASVAHGITSSDISNWNGKTSLTIGTSSTTAAAGNHTHGNITNGGDITTTATIANGDRLIINDESASKITNSSITFGTNDNKYLSNAGTWGDIPTTLPASDVSDWAKADTKPSYTASQVGAATNSHTHGDITNTGDITATAPTIASGDKLIINDQSVSKITNGPSFGTSTTQYLANNGTWQNVPDISGKIDTAGTGLSKSGTTLNHSNSVTAQTTQAVYPIKIDAQGHISEYGSAAIIPDRRSWIGTCSTAAATAAKEVVCSDFTANDLTAGSRILVTFSETNSAAVADLTLSINSTTAKSIKYINNGTLGNLSSAGYLKASTTYLFIYDGTYWVAYFNYNTTYSGMSDAQYQAGTSTTNRLISPARLKAAIQLWDSKVTQSAAITTAGQYPIILGYNTGTAAVTNTVNKSANLTYNPSTKELTNVGGITCGSLDDNYGLNDSALLYQTTMNKWKLILGIEDQEE